jgi:hypothetical protein
MSDGGIGARFRSRMQIVRGVLDCEMESSAILVNAVANFPSGELVNLRASHIVIVEKLVFKFGSFDNTR